MKVDTITTGDMARAPVSTETASFTKENGRKTSVLAEVK